MRSWGQNLKSTSIIHQKIQFLYLYFSEQNLNLHLENVIIYVAMKLFYIKKNVFINFINLKVFFSQ